jgi:hypothetical protein
MATVSTTEISIDHPHHLCRIVEGAARRVFYATPEAVGLCLLGINPQSAATHLQWTDYLTARGVAFGASGHHTYVLMVCPAQRRILPWKSGSNPVVEMPAQVPPVLFSVVMRDQHLARATLHVIKPGWEQRLSVGMSDLVLAVFPYGNVYAHGGICWGTTPIQDITQPSDVEGAFFTSGFNGDLYHPYYCNVHDPTLPALVERTHGDLPLPAASQYLKSVASIIADLGRA